MPLLSHPLELRRTPSLLRKCVRTTLLAAFASAIFVFGLAVLVLWSVD